jgi:hypothetical protein
MGNGVLEVGLPGMPGAGGERALKIADLDEVAEDVAGLVGGGVMAVVAVLGRDRLKFHEHGGTAGQGEVPCAVTAGWPWGGCGGEDPGWGRVARWPELGRGQVAQAGCRDGEVEAGCELCQ